MHERGLTPNSISLLHGLSFYHDVFCHFVVSFEMWKHESTNFSFLWITFAILGSLGFQINFRIILSIFMKGNLNIGKISLSL